MSELLLDFRKSENLALLLGMFAGDGSMPFTHNGDGNRTYRIWFFNTDKSKVELFSRLFYNVFRESGKIRVRFRPKKKPLWEFDKCSKKLAIIFNEKLEMPFGKKADKVVIPSFIKGGTPEMKKLFVFGLLITDGGIRTNKAIIFHMASKQLLIDLSGIIHDIWGIKLLIKEFTQRNKFKSFQINLNMNQGKQILSDLPLSHNLVLR